MRFINLNFVTGFSALVALASAANAQVNIVNTIGNGSKWGINNTRGNGAPIGYDPDVNNALAPVTPQTAGYAVLPFTINGGLFVTSLSQVDIVLNIQPSSGVNSNLASLSGAIVAANNSNSLSQSGLSASDFFSFDTTPNNNPVDAANGDGTTHIFSATNLPAYTLLPNTTYWLVIAPKKGLGATSGDSLLDFGILNDLNAGRVAQSGGALSNPYSTVGGGLVETQGANAGDTLTPITFGAGAGYFGARISGNTVPEPSSLLIMAGGLLATGGTIVRRRRK